MKFRNLSLLCIFLFCLLIVMFCQTEEQVIRTQCEQTPEQLADLIHVSGDAMKLFNDAAKENLIGTIIDFKNNVEKSFLPGNNEDPIAAIGDFLEDQNVILEDTTRNYKRIKRAAHFYRLFREGKINKAKELGVEKAEIGLCIEIKHITIDKIEEEKYDDEGNLLNMIARVIFKYRIQRIDDPRSNNQAGGGSGEFGHRNICTWF